MAQGLVSLGALQGAAAAAEAEYKRLNALIGTAETVSQAAFLKGQADLEAEEMKIYLKAIASLTEKLEAGNSASGATR